MSADLTSITWTLKKGLKWSDGSPVTSADVKFTADYCMHPDMGCAQLAGFDGIKSIDIVDDLTVTVNFSRQSQTLWPIHGRQSPIIQKAQFESCMGAKAPECTEQNFGPIGTGPFVVTDFRPNDVIQYKPMKTIAILPSRHLQRSPSRVAVMPPALAVQFLRQANLIMPGTCSWHLK